MTISADPGEPMFSPMEATLAIAGIFAVIVFAAAFAAEGRGQRLLRILLGVEERRPMREHLFDELERPAGNLDVVESLGRADPGEMRTVRF